MSAFVVVCACSSTHTIAHIYAHITDYVMLSPVPHVRFVVDAGYVKQKVFDPERNMESLVIVPISKVHIHIRIHIIHIYSLAASFTRIHTTIYTNTNFLIRTHADQCAAAGGASRPHLLRPGLSLVHHRLLRQLRWYGYCMGMGMGMDMGI
ncbi:hypothetical protein EON63_24625 [archaeon]|nr:MAG: hypothetical protein EON63_24625 [archaeon]